MAAIVVTLRTAHDMINAAIRAASEPARRFRMLWNLIGASLVGIFVIIGAGYVVGGRAAIKSRTLQLLSNLEFGDLRVHGVIMMLLGMFLANGLGPHYRWVTRLALQLVTLYSLIVAAMIFGGWTLYGISFGAPWWYLLTAFQAIVLLVLAPSVLSVPAPIVDEYGGEEAGGEDA